MFLGKTPHVTALADLEASKELGFRLGIGIGLGSGWSGPTFKVEIDDTRPAPSLVPFSPAHT